MKGQNLMGKDMVLGHFIIVRVASISESGEKTKCMEKGDSFIQTTMLPTMDNGKMTNFLVMELSSISK
jgi:hypothetical protein